MLYFVPSQQKNYMWSLISNAKATTEMSTLTKSVELHYRLSTLISSQCNLIQYTFYFSVYFQDKKSEASEKEQSEKEESEKEESEKEESEKEESEKEESEKEGSEAENEASDEGSD